MITFRVQAYFRQPPASSIRDIFIEPFSKNVWGTLIGIWFLVSLCSLIAIRIKSSYTEEICVGDKELSKDSGLWAVALICQQGWHVNPDSISMKIIFFFGSLMGLIIYVAYSAALVSTLSTVVIPVKKFDDLLQNKFDIILQPGSSTSELILKSEGYRDTEYSSSQSNILQKRRVDVKTEIEGATLVFNSSAAYLGFADSFYAAAKGAPLLKSSRDFCETTSAVRFSNVPFRSGMLVSKNSWYKEYFNHRIVCLYENGLLWRFQREHRLSLRGGCDNHRHRREQSLGPKDLFTAYIILLSGYVFSILVLLIELFVFKHAQKRLPIPPIPEVLSIISLPEDE